MTLGADADALRSHVCMSGTPFSWGPSPISCIRFGREGPVSRSSAPPGGCSTWTRTLTSTRCSRTR